MPRQAMVASWGPPVVQIYTVEDYFMGLMPRMPIAA